MRKYKINRDKKHDLPSKASIGKYKDFSKLSHEYENYTKRHKKPVYKDKRLFFLLILIIILAYLLANA